ncbi:MAG TPA: sigma-70 family RNA polymerase sigma factor [Methylomirabilota bacterium]
MAPPFAAVPRSPSFRGTRRDASRRPAPTHERALVSAARRGDPVARAAVVEDFQPLIAGVARIYRNSPSVDRTELMQEGVVGLLTAVDRYDAGMGTPFWAYASWWVRQAMQRLVAELGRPVVLSDRALRQLARVKDAYGECLRSRGHEPTLCELAVDTGFSKEQIETLLAVERPARGLEDPRNADGGSPDPLVETVADPRAEDEYDRVLPGIAAEKLRQLPGDLCEREKEILRARFGIDGREQTLREIGTRLGLSAERVRQIEERALDKLRAVLC